jgi:PHD/YefM family antitoxin component YafN of YafNO toxin-antitoxin module
MSSGSSEPAKKMLVPKQGRRSMALLTIKSDAARNQFRRLLNLAHFEKTQIIIERYDEPEAVLVGYEDWQKTLRRLSELELLVLHRERKAEVERDPSMLVSQEAFEQMLAMEGLA